MEDKLKEKILTSYKYNPETGDIVGPRGKVVGSNHIGYRRLIINIENINYYILSHRAAWLLYYGDWPKAFIDHIDGNRKNNRISNLRDVSHRSNNTNTKHHRSGRLAGTTKVVSRWRAHLSVKTNNKRNYIHLGYYDSEEEAHQVYLNYLKTHGL